MTHSLSTVNREHVVQDGQTSPGAKVADQQSPEDADFALEIATISARIVSGDPFVERRSTFQAHLCPVNSKREVDLVKYVLMQINKIRNASHNMMAYRIWHQDSQTILQVLFLTPYSKPSLG